MQLIFGLTLSLLKKKGDFAKIQMLSKSKTVFLWHKGQVTLQKLWCMRPNMKFLKASELQSVTL